MDEKYYTYLELDENGITKQVTISRSEIIQFYWGYWNKQMVKKFGTDYAENYTMQDCIDDFCVAHWAVENNA